MQHTRGKRLIGYTRVSTEEQVKESNSLPSQRLVIETWVQARGHTLLDVACDAGKSGTLAPTKRQALCSALGRIHAGKADALIFAKLDRFSRQLRDVLWLMEDAKKRQWDFISCFEQIDTTDSLGRFQLHLFGALAELEVGRVSDRVRTGMATLTKQHRVYTPQAPWGYRLGEADGPWKAARRPRDETGRKLGAPDRRPLVENPEEQRILAAIMSDMDAGRTAYRVAKTLNDQGVPHPRGAPEWLGGSIGAIRRGALRRQKILSGDA